MLFRCVFLWKPWPFSGLFDESSKEQHLFVIDFFFFTLNVFTVTFDKFNASLLNKSIKKNIFWPQTFINIFIYIY